MNGSQFDTLLHALGESRRTLLGGSLAAAVGWLSASATSAKKKHRRRKRKKHRPKRNQFGCVDVGGKCFGNDANCCSGICEGTGKSSVCAAHNALGCDANDETCSESVPCGTEGVCYRTTGKAGFCGNHLICHCLPCAKDSDCEADSGPGAACVVCTGDCAGVKGSQGTACVPAAA